MAEYNLGTARGRAEIDTSDVSNASKELKNADIVLRQSGESLMNFGMQAVQAFGYVVGIGAKFEKEMDYVQAVTAATGEEMEALTQKAIDLGKSGPFGPTELAAAFVELAKAGVTAEQIVNGVGDSVVNLAGAADITATQAGEIIVQTMAIFGLVAEEVPRATDLIAGAANASMIDVSDFATTLKYVGPVAAALGIDLEDLATTISVLGNSGIRGSTAGTSLRQTLLNLAGATPKARERMKELGIITADGANIFYDAQGQVKDLTTVFELLGDSLDGLNEKQKGEALRDIFGVRQLPTVLYLMEQGRATFEDFNATINEVTAADVAAKRLDNLDGAVRRFKATLESVLLGPSGGFQNMLKNFVNAATQLLIWFDELPGPIKTFLLGAVGVVGVLSLMSGAFLLTVGNMVRAVRVFAELSTVFTRMGPMLASVARGFVALNAALLTNPVFLIIAAIVALGVAFYLLYTRVEGFRNFVNAAGREILEVWQKVADWFSGPFVNALSAAWDWVANFFRGIDFGDPLGSIGDLFSSFFDAGFGGEGVTTELSNIFGIMERLGVRFAQVVRGIGGVFADLPGQILGALGSVAGMMTSLGSDIVNGLLGFLQNLPRNIGYILGFAIGRFIKFHIDLVTLVFNIGEDVISTMVDVLTDLPGQLWGILTAALNFMINFGTRMAAEAIKLGTAVLTNIVMFITQLPGRLLSLFTEALNFLVNFIPQFSGRAGELGQAVLNQIVSFLAQLPGNVLSFLSTALGALTGFVSSFFNASLQIGQAILNGILNTVTGLPELVLGILDRVIDAFTGLVSRAYNSAKDFAGGLWDGFKDGLGIRSPSYIEKALFAIDGAAFATAGNVSRAVGQINAGARRLPAITPGGGPVTISGPATVGTGADREPQGQGPTINITIHLNIESFGGGKTVDDAVILSRMLVRESQKQMEAAGKKLVNRSAQFAVATP